MCALPWTHLRLMRDGSTSPCCNYDGPGRPTRQGESLEDALRSEELEEVRREMRDGRVPPGCHRCFEREGDRLEGGSLRQESNALFPKAWLEKPHLRSVEYYFGNQCNLKCRGCGSRHSTKWARDELALGLRPHPSRRTPLQVLDGLWERLEKVKFVGGEPLMAPDHAEFLARLDKSGRLEHVTLEYATNGTIRVSPEILRRWRRAKHLHLTFSVDGLGKANDFFRSGSRWEDVIANIHWYRERLADAHASMGTHTVVNIYNVHHLIELDQWLREEFPGFGPQVECLTSPRWLDVRHLPPPMKEELGARFEEYARAPEAPISRRQTFTYVAGFLRRPFNSDLAHFVREDRRLNELRKVRLEDYHPHLIELIRREAIP